MQIKYKITEASFVVREYQNHFFLINFFLIKEIIYLTT